MKLSNPTPTTRRPISVWESAMVDMIIVLAAVAMVIFVTARQAPVWLWITAVIFVVSIGWLGDWWIKMRNRGCCFPNPAPKPESQRYNQTYALTRLTNWQTHRPETRRWTICRDEEQCEYRIRLEDGEQALETTVPDYRLLDSDNDALDYAVCTAIATVATIASRKQRTENENLEGSAF